MGYPFGLPPAVGADSPCGIRIGFEPSPAPPKRAVNENRERFQKPLYWEGVELTPRDLMALRGIMPPPNL